MKLTDKVLVTGSAGFIGTHLMKALGDRGIEFDLLGSSMMDIVYKPDLEEMIIKHKPQCIVHLAAISSRKAVESNPEEAIRTNITGTYNVLEIAQKYGVRVILASSAAIMEPYSSLYAVTKNTMEDMAGLFDYENIVVTRLYNVYGKGSKSVVNKFYKAIKNSKPVTLNGNTVRDYIHVDDIVKELVRYVDIKSPDPIVLIGTGEATTLKDLVKLIEKRVGKKAKIIQGKSIKEIQESHCYMPLNSFIELQEGINKL